MKVKSEFAPGLLAAASLLLNPWLSGAQGTIDPLKRTSYAANAGYVNWAPAGGGGVVVGESYCTGDAYAANLGWIRFGDGSPTNGYHYANDASGDYGVNHDGTGNLSGYAYGANVGWINFGWASAADTDRPRIDLLTGAVTGYAYGANIGWINLGTGDLVVASLACPDTDRDGISDAWEERHFGSTRFANAVTDRDSDGETDLEEYLADTDPNDPNDYLVATLVELRKTGSRLDPDLRATIEIVSSPTRHYELWSGTDPDRLGLVNSVGTITPSEGGRTVVTYTHDTDARRFYRIDAKRPLKP